MRDAFDGIGAIRHAGETPPRNPSDNSLAVGPDHIVQTVNSQIAVFTKKGRRFDVTGRLVFGPAATHARFLGHGEVCGSRANGDAVVRYDQLAGRWLVVMPIFRRAVPPGGPAGPVAPPGTAAWAGQAWDPGAALAPGPPPAPMPGRPPTAGGGTFAICYAVVEGRESLVAVHSVDTAAGGGGVRWYEFRLDGTRAPQLFQQGAYAPGGAYRWMASPALDRRGNLVIGYSFGDATRFPGQRLAARLADDPKGLLTFQERVLAEGGAAQTTHAPLGGLHPDRGRSRRRLHDLVRRRLPAGRRYRLLDAHRRRAGAGLHWTVGHIHLTLRKR